VDRIPNLAFFFKVTEDTAGSFHIPMTKYDAQGKQPAFYVEPNETKTRDFLPPFEEAYKRLTGAA